MANIAKIKLDQNLLLQLLDFEGGKIQDATFLKGQTEDAPRFVMLTVKHPDMPEVKDDHIIEVHVLYKAEGQKYFRTSPAKLTT